MDFLQEMNILGYFTFHNSAGSYCEAKEKTGRHMVSVQNGDHYKNGVKTNQPGVYNLNDMYAIPEAVIYDILSPALS